MAHSNGLEGVIGDDGLFGVVALLPFTGTGAGLGAAGAFGSVPGFSRFFRVREWSNSEGTIWSSSSSS